MYYEIYLIRQEFKIYLDISIIVTHWTHYADLVWYHYESVTDAISLLYIYGSISARASNHKLWRGDTKS